MHFHIPFHNNPYIISLNFHNKLTQTTTRNEPIVIEDEPESNFQPTPKVANKDTNPCGTKGKAPETGNDENLLLKR